MSKPVVLSKRNTITIPKDARDALGARAGDRAAVLIKGRTVKLVRVPELDELIGILKKDADTSDYREETDRF
jgi:AbrB family looped-hinge helix DNA binding protein